MRVKGRGQPVSEGHPDAGVTWSGAHRGAFMVEAWGPKMQLSPGSLMVEAWRSEMQLSPSHPCSAGAS